MSALEEDRSTAEVAVPPTHDHHDRPILRRVVRWLMIAFVVLALVRMFVFEPFRIPTSSMEPTIMHGDVLLVNKLPFKIRSPRHVPLTNIPIPHLEFDGFGRLERGDVVVFELPHYRDIEEGRDGEYVKRCIAVAGDAIDLVDGRIRVNGREAPPPVVDDDGADDHRRSPINRRRAYQLLQGGGRVIVPYRGYTVTLDSLSSDLWRDLIEDEGVSVEYRNHIVFLSGLPATQYTFRHQYFFAAGDNSADSYDSRFFGFVPYDNLVGRPVLIYWSRDPDNGIRWRRIGNCVK